MYLQCRAVTGDWGSMAESNKRVGEIVVFGMLVGLVLVTTFLVYVTWTGLRHSLEESDVLTAQEVLDFTDHSECHDQLARELIREKGELSKKDAGDVSDICATGTALESFLHQHDAAAAKDS